ncbi:MAG: hypothetical protein QOD84_827 [Acidobacteriaceae bacterium]
MRFKLAVLLGAFLAFALCPAGVAQSPTVKGSSTVDKQNLNATLSVPGSLDQIIDRVVEREHFFVATIRRYHPLIETYIQNLRPDQEMGTVPLSDQYFLGRLDLKTGVQDRSFTGQQGLRRRFMSKLTSLYQLKYLPEGFAQMIFVDSDFQKSHYQFRFVRREFLGEVRCYVIDVEPLGKSKDVRFVGRMWVEDQQYNVVRFNGTYRPQRKRSKYFFHFDSWRTNVLPGVWLPSHVYSEETGALEGGGPKRNFRARTRLWAYDTKHLGSAQQFTQIVVEDPNSVHDQSEAAQDATPVESVRRFGREAEDNVLERLQAAGLLAPEGDVDKVLLTVVNNLIVTNNLNIQPEIRTRVLLTSPLESFTVGHTIIVSRGLLDVLPDEASLAMVLAHELGHIALGRSIDTKLAFNDRMFFPDEETSKNLGFRRSAAEEEAADKKASELLANSPYKDKLSTAGLFLKELQLRAPALKNLIHPYLGSALASEKNVRMPNLANSAPQLQEMRTDQIAALPLGGRIKMDPWTDRVELVKTTAPPVTSPREKMPFEVTPIFPYLTRVPNGTTAANPTPQQPENK